MIKALLLTALASIAAFASADELKIINMSFTQHTSGKNPPPLRWDGEDTFLSGIKLSSCSIKIEKSKLEKYSYMFSAEQYLIVFNDLSFEPGNQECTFKFNSKAKLVAR